MPQFLVTPDEISKNGYIIKGKDYYHLKKARRAKPGDLIDLRDHEGIIYRGIISEINETDIIVKILGEKIKRDVPIDLTLYAGLLKGKKFDFVLQKATEIGVKKIVPVTTDRTIPVISKSDTKKDRWRKIVSEAFKQSMRNDIPVVEDVITFKEAVLNKNSGIRIIAHTEGTGRNIREYLANKNKKTLRNVSVMVGPEGGFTDKEIELAKVNGWDQILFGFTSLRAETASIVLPAILIYEWSNAIEPES